MLLNNTYKLEKKSFQEWYTWLRYSKPQNAPSRRPVKIARRPFGVTEAEWWGNQKIGETEQAYDYQSKTELGYYDLCFDEIVSPEAVDSWNEAYKKYVGNLRDFYSPYFASCTFDRSLYDRAVSTTQNATKPIIFIYGKDDPWTGAAMRDKYRIPVFSFDRELLEKAEGDFTASEFVREQVGVDNVCERAAVLGAGPGAELILRKQARDGMTIAVAKRMI